MINDKPENIQEAIEQLRRQLGFSYAQMGIKAKLDGSTIHKLEKTGRGSMETVVQIARVFGKDINEWLVLADFEPIEPSADDAAEALLAAEERGELTYESEEDGWTAEAFGGATEMSDNDQRRIKSIVKKLIETDRRRRGKG